MFVPLFTSCLHIPGGYIAAFLPSTNGSHLWWYPVKGSKNIWLVALGLVGGPTFRTKKLKCKILWDKSSPATWFFVVKQAAVDVFVGNHGGTKCNPFVQKRILGGMASPSIVLVVNYHGDHKFPKDRVAGPLH